MSSSILLEGEDKSLALTALVVSAVNDAEPRHDLKQLYQGIVQNDLKDELDPLGVVPHLIVSDRDGCDDLLALMSECSSAKEMNIVLQEVLEHLLLEVNDGEDENATGRISHVGQLSRIIISYAAVIPRLKIRKSRSDVLQPIFAELQKFVLPATSSLTTKEARELVDNASHLVRKTLIWTKDASSLSESSSKHCNTILASFLDTVIEACSNTISSSLAQRLFEKQLPRLVLRSSVRKDWEEGEKAVQSAIEASALLDRSFDSLSSLPTTSSMFLIAHSSMDQLSIPRIIPIFPALLTSLQSNVALDEALAILLTVLYLSTSPTQSDLPPDVIIPLSTILPPLCSSHPDPATRHLTFRLLGQLLRLTPSPLRLQILTDLLAPSDDAFPQMRVAAIGLVKEAVLEALFSSNGAPSGTLRVFASPLLLQTIGAYVFRTDPPTLLGSGISVKEFMESPEPARLAECLGLYYVLLLRDVSNKTGIRDASMVRNIESSFLGPLRTSVSAWLNDSNVSNDLHEILPLASLQTNIERVDGALKTIST